MEPVLAVSVWASDSFLSPSLCLWVWGIWASLATVDNLPLGSSVFWNLNGMSCRSPRSHLASALRSCDNDWRAFRS